MCKTRIQQKFIIKRKYKYDMVITKKMYQKLMLNKLKVIRNCTPIYTH